MKSALEKAKIGDSEKQEAIKSLHKVAMQIEKDFIPNNNFDKIIEQERRDSWKYGGRTVMGFAQPPIDKKGQMKLF